MAKVRQEADGSFTIDFIKKVNGKRIHITKKGFKDQYEAEIAIPSLTEKRVSSLKQYGGGKFESFFKEYLEHRSHKVGGSTLLSIKAIYNVILINYAETEVREVLGVHNVISLYKGIIKRKNVGEKWKNRVIGELRFIVDYACFLKLISPEVCSDDKAILESVPITKKSKERDSYSYSQLKKFLDSIDEEEDKDMMMVYVYLGARISEFVALTWDCYDKSNKTIEIKQQVLYLQKGKPILTDRLKTKESYRKCKLNNEIYAILEKRRKKCDKGFIFPKSKNRPNDPLPKSAIRKKMKKYMNKAKLPYISPHGFRHSKATLFMSVCKTMAEVKAAAKFMGHSVTMMMETYAHSEEKTIDLLIKRLEDK